MSARHITILEPILGRMNCFRAVHTGAFMSVWDEVNEAHLTAALVAATSATADVL